MIPTITKVPYSDRFKKLNLPTLVYRRARGDMIEMFKEMKATNKGINPVVTIYKSVSRGHNLFSIYHVFFS